jgi:putative ABC transport system permease protein
MFRWLEMIRLGLTSLRLHLSRSILTMLGIVFGVGAVVCMLSITQGAQEQVLRLIGGMGLTSITALTKKPPETTRADPSQQNLMIAYGLTFRDAVRLKETLPKVEISVTLRDLRKDAYVGSTRLVGRVVATESIYADAAALRVERGRFIAPLDEQTHNAVCVLGADARRQLFPLVDPLGRDIKVGGLYLRVVGVLAPVEESQANTAQALKIDQPIGISQLNKTLFVPLRTALARFGIASVRRVPGGQEFVYVELDEIRLRVEDVEAVTPVAQTVENVLRRAHPTDDYELQVPLALLRQSEESQATFKVVMIAIASISLLVGGIGIMNIMLTSVTERTREIGIRRATGATRGDITRQFLIETTVLSSVGGLVGISLGVLGAHAVTWLANWYTALALWSLPVSFGVAALVGLVFGLYPAMRAARMDPIEALRHE